MMRGVFHHGPHDVTHRLATHDRTWWKRMGKLLGCFRPQELDGPITSSGERRTCLRERFHFSHCFDLFFKVEIESSWLCYSIDEPVESLCSMRHVLRRRHHSFARAEL